MSAICRRLIEAGWDDTREADRFRATCSTAWTLRPGVRKGVDGLARGQGGSRKGRTADGKCLANSRDVLNSVFFS